MRVLCTLGPSSLNEATLRKLESRGVDLFRINLSHTPLDRVEETIRVIRAHSGVPICLDTEGAQVRTGPMRPGVTVNDRDRILLVPDVPIGDATTLGLTPPSVFASLAPNTLIGLDFDSVILMVLGQKGNGVEAVALNGGRIGSNKAAVIDPRPTLPALSPKDLEAIRIGRDHGIEHYAMSFTNCADDVRDLRALVGPRARIISKIESRRGVANIDEILSETDEILIDRGDLSQEVRLETLPFLQKLIVRKAAMAKTPVNVATNLLESMIVNRKPTRAEINDIVNTLLDGASGLVLAAETAIGEHPVEVVDMVLNLIDCYEKSSDGYTISQLLEEERPAPKKQPTRQRSPANGMSDSVVQSLQGVEIDEHAQIDVEHLLSGVYGPVQRFMTGDDLACVLDSCRMPDGNPWTMPILLQGKSQEFAGIHAGQSVRLLRQRTGQPVAIMHIEEKHDADLTSVAKRWFGTDDHTHPGVAAFFARGLTMLAGRVEAVESHRFSPIAYRLSPEKARKLFDFKGWSKIVACHAGVADHKDALSLASRARANTMCDGVLVHRTMGALLQNTEEARLALESYDRELSAVEPASLLATISLAPRHAGARELVFAAMCRRSFGCSHFAFTQRQLATLWGASVEDAMAMLESLGDIGITPVMLPEATP